MKVLRNDHQELAESLPGENDPAWKRITGEKQSTLEGLLSDLGSVLVAYSGGTNSTFLAWQAYRVLGSNMRAVIADSSTLGMGELSQALADAERHGFPVEVVRIDSSKKGEQRDCETLRTFHCQNELFKEMEKIRLQLGFKFLTYGLTVDDHTDFRPGQAAAKRHGVVAPLATEGLSKDEIQYLSRLAGLRRPEKPLETSDPVISPSLRVTADREEPHRLNRPATV